MGSSVFFMDRLREIELMYVFFQNQTGISMREIAVDVFSGFLVESAEGRSTYRVFYVAEHSVVPKVLRTSPLIILICGVDLWCGFVV
jgi:hypothetical protein